MYIKNTASFILKIYMLKL